MGKHRRKNDKDTRALIQQWRKDGLADSSITIYLHWVRRFQTYCSRRGMEEYSELTASGVDKFRNTYVGPRKGGLASLETRNSARNALKAWAYALQSLGVSLPPWSQVKTERKPNLLMEEYIQYRKDHRDVSVSTLQHDLDTANKFIEVLKDRGRSFQGIQMEDIDAFIKILSVRYSKKTIASSCSSIRGFLQFLHASGKCSNNWATAVIAPRVKRVDRPPRALTWGEVRRILCVIPRDCRIGRRDYAMFLMMVTYGMGAAEVLGLRLEDIDWSGGIIHVCRPKTSISIELPLLSAIARALSIYIRYNRPPHAETRNIFISMAIPHSPLTSGGIRHRVREYAKKVGIEAKVLGAHIFRHSHASRQIDSGANVKTVSDILGHSSTTSTSVYVQVAFKRLRGISLPVPK